jgi:hypothetical protein
MIEGAYLDEVEARAVATSGDEWALSRNEVGECVIEVVFPDEHRVELRATRELEPAGEADLSFIAHAPRDVRRLVQGLRDARPMTPDALAEVDRRCVRASPGPWTAFIEADGGLGGSDVIRVSERDDEPDLYLWFGSDLAPSADFRFVAAARQDIPRLIEATRDLFAAVG